MDEVRNDLWGVLVLRGILAILFGFAAVFWPGLTLVTLVYLFGAFLLINGVITLVLAMVNSYNVGHSMLTRVLTMLLGVAEIGVGIYMLRNPHVAFATLVLLIGFILIVRGVIDFVAAFVEDEGTLFKTVSAIGGILAVLAGILMLFQPAAAGVAFVWILGIYGLIVGPLLIALGIDIKKGTDVLPRTDVVPPATPAKRSTKK